MRRHALLVFWAAMGMAVLPGRGVEYDINSGTYVNTPPDDTASGESVSGWDSGWNGSGVTGWNYVGQLSGGSGVYLGGGWVLTAGHVGGGKFTLNGTTYDEVPGSAQNVPNNSVDSAIDSSLSGTTADLTLFQISSSPSLPSLTLALDAPTEFGDFTDGSAVVMIGYGGGDGETWGENNVTNIDQTTPLNFNGNWDSLDFYTLNGSYSNFVGGINNKAQLVVFDSGGGDFIYNAATHEWELAGINEAQLVDNSNNVVGSAFVQLSDYAAQIDSITGLSLTATPEPPRWLLLGLGLGAIWAWNCRAVFQMRRPALKSRCTGPSAI